MAMQAGTSGGASGGADVVTAELDAALMTLARAGRIDMLQELVNMVEDALALQAAERLILAGWAGLGT